MRTPMVNFELVHMCSTTMSGQSSHSSSVSRVRDIYRRYIYNWTGLDDCIVFAHAQTFKRECTFAPALPKAPSVIIGKHT